MTYSMGSYGQSSGGGYAAGSAGAALGALASAGTAAAGAWSTATNPQGSGPHAPTYPLPSSGVGGAGAQPGGRPGIPGFGGETPKSPIRGGAGVVSSGYGYRENPKNPGETQFHGAVDIAAPAGTPLYSPITGTIIKSGNDVAMGNYVKIQGADGNVHTLMHMTSTFMAYPGAPVTSNSMIGFVGSTGISTGNHVHWQINAPNGKTVNPMPYLNN